MKKILFIACLISAQFCFAQEEEAAFAFVESPAGSTATSLLMKEADYKKNYRYKVAKQVFDDLIQAKGDYRLRVPSFVMSNSERRVALAKPRKAEITLEAKAYDICASFGKDSLNALAALLSHELVHYYEKHNWENAFGESHGDTLLKRDSHEEKIKEGLKLETQADHLGGFLAYSAGYSTLDVMPLFLDKVYQVYGLPEEIRGYPSLAERKAIANLSLQKLESFISVFETANYLTALEKYDYALIYLNHILKDFQSRELFNNVGVLSVLAALDFFTIEELKGFRYPVELDIETRLRTGTKGDEYGFGEKVEIRNRLLDNATQAFEQAAILDKNYPIAMLNLACVFTLKEAYDDAAYFCKKALQLAKDKKWAKTKSDILVLQGIIAAHEKEKDDAQRFFEKAIQLNNSLATYNLSILNGEKPNAVFESSSFAMPERIDGVNIDAEVNQLYAGNLTMDATMEITKEITFGTKNFPNSKLSVHLILGEGKYIFIHATRGDYDGETNKKLTLNATREDITKGYGAPYRAIGTSKGEIWIYYKKKLLFFFDQDGQLTRWAVFRVEDGS